MNSIHCLSNKIIQNFYADTADHVFTVAISGIDASGKGYVSKLLENELIGRGLTVAIINLDPWQNPIGIRLQKQNAAKNFYERGFRWKELFDQLIIPLKQSGNLKLTSRLIKTHADEYYDFHFNFNNINVLLVEGIFLFQKRFQDFYDLKIWIECSFETAMQRAILRNSEKLTSERLVEDYCTYYFPAQLYHFQKDHPRLHSDIIYYNDDLMGTVWQMTKIF